MQVIFANGEEGCLNEEQAKNLYIKGRFTKQEWKELETEMLRLNIIKFDDPFLHMLGADFVPIEYVKNQIAIR